MIFSGKEKLGPSVKLEENKEEDIKEFVRDLIFSNKIACELSALAVIAAISYFVDTDLLTVLRSLDFLSNPR